jgi:tetratricopeptide (TPR) repeat protein
MRARLLLVPLLLPLAGCSTLGGHLARLFHVEQPAKLEVRAVAAKAPTQEAAHPPSLIDRLYSQARYKIELRDYADALDLLQLARDGAPDDARVLNAMGVIYDKLGRLDLSKRYYEMALAQEPGSPVVLANMRYSDLLGSRFAAVEAARAAPTAQTAPVQPPQVQLTFSTPPASREPVRTAEGAIVLAAAPPDVAVMRLGSPVMLVDASGRENGPEPVRAYLTSAGWSVADGAGRAAAPGLSEIRFPSEHRALAQALARTLPFKVALSDCGAKCAGLELVVGQDAPSRLKTFAKEHS